MAIAATTVWSARADATASDVNGCGFNPNNANFPTDLAADTNTGNTSAPVVSSATYTFVAGDVGHWVYIKSGTNWTTGWYQIASVSGGKATLSADIGQAALASSSTYAANLNTVAGCATVGTPTAGTFGIDYSQSASTTFTASDLAGTNANTASPLVTSASQPFGINHVGNLLHINSGTSWTSNIYEIASVSGVTATLDRQCASVASPTSGTFHLGGSASISTTAVSTSLIAGNKIYVKSGTYTYGLGSITNGVATAPISIIGFSSIRGDACVGTNRPLFSTTSTALSVGNFALISNIRMGPGGATNQVGVGSNSTINNCSFIVTNAGVTGALNLGGACQVINTEIVNVTGTALTTSSAANSIYGCHIHDSKVGISMNAGWIVNNIIESCTTGVSLGGFSVCANNTFYGTENKIGTAANLGSGAGNMYSINNIYYGWATAVSNANAGQTSSRGEYNDYYNNTTDVSNFAKSKTDLALNPGFTSVASYFGTNAAVNNTTVTVSGVDFSNVVDGQTYIYLGNTGNHYLITGHTTTTLTLSVSTGVNISNVTYYINYSKNFGIGANLKSMGVPQGTYPGSNTTNYWDIGAVQRLDTSLGPSAFTFVGS